MKNLEMYGVQEMDAKEMKKSDGGSFLAILAAGLIIACVVEVISDWDNFERGFNGEPWKE